MFASYIDDILGAPYGYLVLWLGGKYRRGNPILGSRGHLSLRVVRGRGGLSKDHWEGNLSHSLIKPGISLGLPRVALGNSS